MDARRDDISLLYIEDEAAIRESMLEFLSRRFERVRVAENGAEGLELYRESVPDIVLTDIRMPVMGGLEMARAIMEFDGNANIILTSAHSESSYLLEAIQMGINNYLLKPLEWNKVDAALQRCIEAVLKTRDMRDRENLQTEEAFHYTITSLARAAEANDEDNGNHILRVGEYSAAICRRMGFSEQLADGLALQSQLHDVGKIHVPPEILKKPGKLTEAEMMVMREHTVFGARIIGSHPRLETARSIALNHHEHWDGSGYPSGLYKTRIPLMARIVAIADVYDALRNRRIYKAGFDHATACRIILEGDGRTDPSHFDPDILGFFRNIEKELETIYERHTTEE